MCLLVRDALPVPLLSERLTKTYSSCLHRATWILEVVSVRRLACKERSCCFQALKEGKLRGELLQPDERRKRPGLSVLILDEADLILSMPGYDEDLQMIAPQVDP